MTVTAQEVVRLAAARNGVELDVAPPTARQPLASLLVTRDGLANLPQPCPLIVDTIEVRTVALLSGRRSTGKSFLALDWACCIATGKPWQGRQVVQPGRVLYIAAEGAHGLHNRVSAWESAWHRQVAALDVLPVAVNLFSGDRFDELLQIVRETGYRLVVIDTWARSTAGGQENNNTDSTVSFERVDALRQTGATVLVVAHTDATDSKTRGATALEDNADTVYRSKGDPQLIELSRDKRKDGPTEDLHRLQLQQIRLGEDPDGRPITSCVVQNTRGQDHDLTGRAEDLMSAFREHFADTGATKAELRLVAEMPSASYARSLNALVRAGALVNQGSDQRPFYRLGDSHVG